MGQSRLTAAEKYLGSGLPATSTQKVEADGIRVFYRAAVGYSKSPVVLLLHGFPALSFMFR